MTTTSSLNATAWRPVVGVALLLWVSGVVIVAPGLLTTSSLSLRRPRRTRAYTGSAPGDQGLHGRERARGRRSCPGKRGQSSEGGRRTGRAGEGALDPARILRGGRRATRLVGLVCRLHGRAPARQRARR